MAVHPRLAQAADTTCGRQAAANRSHRGRGENPRRPSRGATILACPACLLDCARRIPAPRPCNASPMILPRYRIAPSTIPGAGKGVFLDETTAPGRILVAPDGIDRLHRYDDILARDDSEAALAASVRWFEDRFTVSLDWPDECYINHSFSPNGLWHLGFVFALRSIAPGEELCVDYRHLLGEGQQEPYRDALTGQPIVGLPWHDSLAATTAQLAAALAARAAQERD